MRDEATTTYLFAHLTKNTHNIDQNRFTEIFDVPNTVIFHLKDEYWTLPYNN